LRFAKVAQDFSQIRDEAGEDQPSRMAIPAKSFRCLKEMVSLGKIQIRVALIDKGIEERNGYLNPHFFMAERQILFFFFEDVVQRLMRVVCKIEIPYTLWGCFIIDAKELFSFLFSSETCHGAAGEKIFYELF
jgi:hypothetical protein